MPSRYCSIRVLSANFYLLVIRVYMSSQFPSNRPCHSLLFIAFALAVFLSPHSAANLEFNPRHCKEDMQTKPAF
ncbi:hypothetical protein Ancab_011181 [Ancistrocladus abbreviatus]